MKQFFLFNVIMCVLCLSSCTKDVIDTQARKDSKFENDAYTQFLQSVDSLSASFSTRGGDDITEVTSETAKRVLIATADAIAAKGGAIAGSSCGPIGSGAGSFVGSILGSWAYEKYLEWVAEQMDEKKDNKEGNKGGNKSRAPRVGLPFPLGNIADAVDSIGFIHNQVIADMLDSGNSFLSDDGSFDKGELYNYCIQAIGKYTSICSSFSNNQSFRDKILGIVFMSVNAIYSVEKQEISFDEAVTLIEDSLSNSYGAAPNSLYTFKTLHPKLIKAVTSMNEDDVNNYTEDLLNIIKESNMSSELKNEVRLISDMTVNSNLLWKSVYQQ